MAENRGRRRPVVARVAGARAGAELIVVTRAEHGVRARALGVASATAADVSALDVTLRALGARMAPLFGVTEDRVLRTAFVTHAGRAEGRGDLSRFYRVSVPAGSLADAAKRLAASPSVLAAYVKPAAVPAAWRGGTAGASRGTSTRAAVGAPADAPPTTPDFESLQGYLEAAPAGVGARFAWTLPGGGGDGVTVADVEGDWLFSHEDLSQNQGGVVGGVPMADLEWRNHGTAVLGVFSGDRNGTGVTGISPEARAIAVSAFDPVDKHWSSSSAIYAAARRLSAGDVLLVELHRPGPAFGYEERVDQRGYIALEWWPDDFAAIRAAVDRGVIVVAAAGNGAEDLDDPVYSKRPSEFPPDWRNPFDRSTEDAGSVLVGAGEPPTGGGRDRSRCDFSNFGACVDAQGWGRSVVTCGYGDLQGGPDERAWYTREFSGTSSASPIVVGALACVQGVLRARGAMLLTPATARDYLRRTGSPQQAAPGAPVRQRVGNRPDVRAILSAALGVPLGSTPSAALVGAHPSVDKRRNLRSEARGAAGSDATTTPPAPRAARRRRRAGGG